MKLTEKEKNNKNNLEKKSSWYLKLEESGINYINKYKYYLILSALLPIFLIIIQIINTSFIALVEKDIPLIGFKYLIGFEIFAPRFKLMTISVIGLVKFIYLFNWNRKLIDYREQYKNFMKNNNSVKEEPLPKESFPLTRLFYEIISQMKISKVIFILINVICFVYFFWNFVFFLVSPPIPQPLFPLFRIIGLFNFISQLILIAYLIFEWRHFYRWNKKLKKLSNFEKKIYSELFQSE